MMGIQGRVVCYVMVLLGLVYGYAQSTETELAQNHAVIYFSQGVVKQIPRKATGVKLLSQNDIQSLLRDFIQYGNQTSQSGFVSPIPLGTELLDMQQDQDEIKVYLSIPADSLKQLNVIQVDDFYTSLGKTLYGVSSSLQISILVWDTQNQTYKPLSSFLPVLPPIPRKPYDMSSKVPTNNLLAVGQPSGFGQGQPAGFLSGKSAYISAGHGWYYDSGTASNSIWYTQRGNTNDLVEDFSNIEAVDQYLCQYLWNAGANVWTCRARNRDEAYYIVDNTDSGYAETGTWNASASASGYYGTGYRTAACASTPTVTATWRPTIALTGYYPVYIWYTAGTNRCADAHILITHSGGSTLILLNMQHEGSTWKYLGIYHFIAGTSGSVQLTNQSSNPTGYYVIADAIRIGDGKGSISRGTVTSGKYKTDECSRYWAEFMGAPSTIYSVGGPDNSDDVTCRPQYAEWERESWEDPFYLSWHTNAGGGTGTEGYIWSTTFAYGQSASSDGPATAGSYNLMSNIYDRIINDVRTVYNSGWVSRGKFRNNYGELRPLSTMPGALIESAYHDNSTTDSVYLKDPKFRQLLARAMYHGIVQYFANRDSLSYTYLPEPPLYPRVVNNGDGTVTLTWKASSTDSNGVLGNAAASYKVYRSLNGYGFDNGTTTSGTSLTVTSLAADSVYYFKITALNAGGESFPTETLAVRIRASDKSQILLVNGYDQEAEWMLPKITEKCTYSSSGSDNGTPKRMLLDKVNSFNYLIQHAQSIANTSTQSGGKYYFDSANHYAVADGSINLSNYAVVIWVSGRQTNDSPSRTLTSAEQTKISSYLSGGKSFFISGSEIGWDLGQTSGSADSTFYANYLKATFVTDNSGSNGTGNGADVLNGLSSFSFGDTVSAVYSVGYPDQIAPVNGSADVLEYGAGTTVIDTFDSLVGWKAPNYSGTTNADTTSTFGIVASPIHGGSGAGDLYYVWGTGNLIREYNSSLPQFPMTASVSIWIYGDGSGNNLRLCARDTDNDLFVNTYVPISFTGWQQLIWATVNSNSSTALWVKGSSGDSTINGPNLKLDSIQLSKVGSNTSGHIYFDDLVYMTTGGGGNGKVAGVKYDGSFKLLYLGFPFESIIGQSSRDSLMQKSLYFLNLSGVPVELTGFSSE